MLEHRLRFYMFRPWLYNGGETEPQCNAQSGRLACRRFTAGVKVLWFMMRRPRSAVRVGQPFDEMIEAQPDTPAMMKKRNRKEQRESQQDTYDELIMPANESRKKGIPLLVGRLLRKLNNAPSLETSARKFERDHRPGNVTPNTTRAI